MKKFESPQCHSNLHLNFFQDMHPKRACGRRCRKKFHTLLKKFYLGKLNGELIHTYALEEKRVVKYQNLEL